MKKLEGRAKRAFVVSPLQLDFVNRSGRTSCTSLASINYRVAVSIVFSGAVELLRGVLRSRRIPTDQHGKVIAMTKAFR
jgi:hypothetical protein